MHHMDLSINPDAQPALRRLADGMGLAVLSLHGVLLLLHGGLANIHQTVTRAGLRRVSHPVLGVVVRRLAAGGVVLVDEILLLLDALPVHFIQQGRAEPDIGDQGIAAVPGAGPASASKQRGVSSPVVSYKSS